MREKGWGMRNIMAAAERRRRAPYARGAGKVRQKRLEQLARQAAVGNSLGKQKRDGDEDKIF